jgi:hypothetical protein
MAPRFTTSYLEDPLSLFRYYKKPAERGMEQVIDEQLFVELDQETNSIAIVVKHMAGNMRLRWTDFITSDGEKADRDRDSEFVSDADLGRTVTIRGEAHSVRQAVNRQVADRNAGEAFRARSMAIAERAAEPVGGVYSESRSGELSQR